jgi:hypothetical protein
MSAAMSTRTLRCGCPINSSINRQLIWRPDVVSSRDLGASTTNHRHHLSPGCEARMRVKFCPARAASAVTSLRSSGPDHVHQTDRRHKYSLIGPFGWPSLPAVVVQLGPQCANSNPKLSTRELPKKTPRSLAGETEASLSLPISPQTRRVIRQCENDWPTQIFPCSSKFVAAIGILVNGWTVLSGRDPNEGGDEGWGLCLSMRMMA